MKRIMMYFLLLGLLTTACKPGESTNATQEPVADAAHNSRNSLDWDGTYRGVLPCADCEGIKTELTLTKEGTYMLTKKYLGKSGELYQKSGPFSWNDNGSQIMLDNDKDQQYMVGENILFKLNRKGQRIEGDLANNYQLQKMEEQITNTYWKLVELRGRPIKVVENQRKEAHFILRQENKVTGHTGCNNFHGTYELVEGSRIKFGPMASTMMACMNIDYEHEYLKVFEMADNYSIRGDTMTLNKARMAPLAKFVSVYFH